MQRSTGAMDTRETIYLGSRIGPAASVMMLQKDGLSANSIFHDLLWKA